MLRESVIVVALKILVCVTAYEIKLVDDGPIVTGGTIHFTASVYDDGQLTDIELKYQWSDNAIPQHTRKTEKVYSPTDTWSVTYTDAPPGPYVAQVIVFRCTSFLPYCYQIGSVRISFDITDSLNGKMILQQSNKTLSDTGKFVSTRRELVQKVELKKSDMDFIKTAPTIQTFWFVDCVYYGITNGFEFPFNYTVPYENHLVEALILADFTPLPTTTTPPTTTSTTTTPKPNGTTTTTTPTTTTTRSTTKIPTPTSKVQKRDVTDTSTIAPTNSDIKVWHNGTLVPYNVSFPYVCNSTYVSSNNNQIYGYFYRQFQSKDPVSGVNITGNNWLQPGDMLTLRVQWAGSKNFGYCAQYRRGEYNVTGNETCDHFVELDDCDVPIRRFLNAPKTTVVVIIQNDINKVVKPVTVNIYEVKKQGQLSVIVVPVAFSLVAVVLIVFGVAYYFQNRSRFIIEVADFNFGQQYSDMEYKTFRERLVDSIANACSRAPTPSSSEVPVWPPGRKYGSMT